MATSHCPNCRLLGRRAPLVRERRAHCIEVAGRVFSTELPTDSCRACGQRFDLAPRRVFERDVARRLADEGETHPEAVRLLCEAADLGVTRVARLLGVTRQTVSRWMSGASPIDRASFTVLRLLLLERLAGTRALHDWLEGTFRAGESRYDPPGRSAR